MFTKNAKLSGPLKTSPWRKAAMGSWHGAGDPTVYGFVDVDAGMAMEYIKKLREKTGQRVTLSHFCGKIAAEICRRHPEINRILRFGKIYQRETIDVFFMVATDSAGEDLSGLVIRDADRKSIQEIAREMESRLDLIRSGRDPDFINVKRQLSRIPAGLVRSALRLLGFIMFQLNLWSPLLGCARDAFGGVMVTNVGSLGIHGAWAPLIPYTHVPFVMSVGALRDAPVVKDGVVCAGRLITIGATVDHRIIDGLKASQISKTVQRIFENPEAEFGSI
ncbi:MAG: hypothetical protein A2583_06350 [Bdellovibrionales bacterium RIFOXYD1_FULL_53_11]|nr:MAG: hypothetical protein A2583_06350 [Bdellovibrionales bacterium RIFOXYD1_FULL_53_11]